MNSAVISRGRTGAPTISFTCLADEQVPEHNLSLRVDFGRKTPRFRGKMPIYEYELCKGSCAACGGKFTLRRPLSAAALTQCPACKKPVRKIISSFSSPIKLKPVSFSDAKKAGFTVLKRLGKGEYEKQ